MLVGFIAIALMPMSAASGAVPVETVISAVLPSGTDAAAHVDIRLLNGAVAATNMALPKRLQARLVLGGETVSAWLERCEDTPAVVAIPAGGFARARYRLELPVSSLVDRHGLLSIVGWSTAAVAFDFPAASRIVRTDASPPAVIAPAPSDRTRGNAFLPNLSVYEPIYAVYGPGTNSAARIQFSFKYQLFGNRAQNGKPASLLDGVYFAYTQRMFWDLGRKSSPFRNIDYQPEVFYLAPALALRSGATVSGQIGFRHESNGRDGPESRSLNTLYVAPMAAVSIGGGYRITLAPRFWLYAGDLGDNPDVRRYRGNSGLFVEIGDDDGLRLSTSSRFNLSSGKGSVGADLSYPLSRILGGGPDLYVFGQSFAGYGENLLDYNRRITRFRLGVALVR